MKINVLLFYTYTHIKIMFIYLGIAHLIPLKFQRPTLNGIKRPIIGTNIISVEKNHYICKKKKEKEYFNYIFKHLKDVY
jgi:hypothetical protein